MLLFGCPAPAEVALANNGKFWYVYNDNIMFGLTMSIYGS